MLMKVMLSRTSRLDVLWKAAWSSMTNESLLMRRLAICLIMMSCLVLETPVFGESAQAQQQLNDSRTRWTSKNIKDYQYTFNWSCFCPPEHNKAVIISVRNGAVASIKYADGSGPVDKSKYPNYRTIEGLFEFIQDAINRKAYRITASYDSNLGYPTSASIDYDQRIADEEKSFKAEGLVADAR